MKRINFQFTALVGGLFLLMVSASAVSAQDWNAASSGGRETLVDTTLIEAVIITLAPGEKIGPFTHPAYFAYALTGGKLKVHLPEGEPMVMEFEKGFSGFFGPEGPHMPENIGTETAKFLVVELKEHPYKAPGSQD